MIIIFVGLNGVAILLVLFDEIRRVRSWHQIEGGVDAEESARFSNIKMVFAKEEKNHDRRTIQLIALGFEESTPTGKILPALDAATASGAIRLVDLQFVGKDANGDVTALEMTSLSEDAEVEFGAVIGGLIGAGIAGKEGVEVGALEVALAVAEQSYGLTAADIHDIASELAPGDAAALLMIEHKWAIDFRDAVLEAGGVMLGQGFLTPGTLILIGAELEAQTAALAAIEEAAAVVAVSEVIEEEAVLEAADAVFLSEVIQEEAARRAVNALVASDLIEEAAMEEAASVLAAALAVKEAVGGLAAGDESAKQKQEALGRHSLGKEKC